MRDSNQVATTVTKDRLGCMENHRRGMVCRCNNNQTQEHVELKPSAGKVPSATSIPGIRGGEQGRTTGI